MKLIVRSACGVAVALVGVACGADHAAGEPKDPAGSSLQRVAPSRNLHLRASFDGDPSSYVGRFVPDDVKGAELDETRASQTVCSSFFHAKLVPANQELDELMYVSSGAEGSLGLIAGGGAMNARAAKSAGSVVRVHYKVKQKMQVDSDPVGLAACCSKNPGACTTTVMGEFVMGSGEIYESTQDDQSASADVGVAPVAAHASYQDSSQWRKAQSFTDTFFAFSPIATGTVNSKADASCDFCNHLPEDANGLYFCGVSNASVEEQTGRDGAMDSARVQVVKYLGQQIETKSATLSSSAKGLISDERFTQAVSKGLATRVKDQRYCSLTENSPEHRQVYKVLAFVPNDALVDAASKAIDDVAATVKASAKDTAAAKDAVKNATANPAR